MKRLGLAIVFALAVTIAALFEVSCSDDASTAKPPENDASVVDVAVDAPAVEAEAAAACTPVPTDAAVPVPQLPDGGNDGGCHPVDLSAFTPSFNAPVLHQGVCSATDVGDFV